MSKVIGDGGYDAHSFFRYLHHEGIHAGILVRKGSKVKGNPLRDEVVRAIRRGKKRLKEVACREFFRCLSDGLGSLRTSGRR